MKSPLISRELALTLLLSFAAFASVTNGLQIGPLLTALTAEFAQSESAIGRVASISSLVGTAVALALAPLIHRWPMRRWLTLQCAVLIVSAVVMASAQSFEMLVLARVLSGVGGGAIMAVCFTAAAEITTNPAMTGRAVAIVASGTTVATLVGIPILALIRGAFGWRWASAFVIAPLVVVLAGSRWLPGSVHESGEGEDAGRSAMSALIRHDPTRIFLLVTFFFFVVYFGWVVYISAYAESAYGAGSAMIGGLFVAAGLAELAGNSAAPSLARRYSSLLVALAGCLAGAMALLGIGVIFTTLALLMVSVALLNFAFSFMYIGSTTALIETATGERATVLALASVATGLGAAAGSLLGSGLLDLLGDYEPMFQILGVILLVAALCLWLSRWQRSIRRESDTAHSGGGER